MNAKYAELAMHCHKPDQCRHDITVITSFHEWNWFRPKIWSSSQASLKNQRRPIKWNLLCCKRSTKWWKFQNNFLLNIDLHHLKGCWEQTLVHITVAVHMSLNSIASSIAGSSERERKSEYGTEEGEWNELDSLIGPGRLLLEVAHLFAVPVLVLWVGLENQVNHN